MSVKRSVVLLCSLILLASTKAFARNSSAIKAFNQAVQAFNAKQFTEAIRGFDEAIYNDNEFVEAYFARGACKYYLKSLDGALMDLNDALRLKPDYVEARALRGALNYERDQWDNALDDFSKVLEVNPKDAQSLLGRAVILLKRQNLEGAARDFKAFLAVRPDDPLAPKVRQLLASLQKPREVEPSAQTPAAPARPNASQPARRPARTVRALTPEEIQALADSLVGRRASESYNQKVLHGERAEATGGSPQVVDPH